MHVVVVWLCSFDLGKRVDVVEAGRRLMSSGLAEALLTYDVNGEPQIEPREMSREDSLLFRMGREDKTLLLEEYRKSGRIARLKLRGLKAKVLNNDSEVETYLTIHRTGFAVLSFWLFVNGELELSSIIKIKDPSTPIQIAGLWPGLIQQLEKLKFPGVSTLDEAKVAETTLDKLCNLYVRYVQSTFLRSGSFEKLLKKLRYPYFEIKPVVGILDVDNSEKFVEDHLKELYGIITKEERWNWVQDYWVKRELGRNLAYREGWHVYIGSNGALIVIPKEAHDILREMLMDREKFSENELKRAEPYQILFALDLIIVLEYLVFQEITLRTINYKLDQGLSESFKKVAKLEEEISTTLDEFLNSYAWSRTIVKEWVKYGKNKMGIDEKYESIRRRLDTIKDSIETAYKISVNFMNFLLALLATYIGFLSLREMLPSWLVNSVTLMIFFFFVVVLIVLMCRSIWRWLWKHCGRLKGQSRRIYKGWVLFKMCPYAIIEVNAMIIVPLHKNNGELTFAFKFVNNPVHSFLGNPNGSLRRS